MNDLINNCFLHGNNSFIISVDDYFILGSINHDQPNTKMRLFYDI